MAPEIAVQFFFLISMFLGMTFGSVKDIVCVYKLL